MEWVYLIFTVFSGTIGFCIGRAISLMEIYRLNHKYETLLRETSSKDGNGRFVKREKGSAL